MRMEKVEEHQRAGTLAVTDLPKEVVAAGGEKTVSTQQGPSKGHRGKGRGRPVFANTKGLVQAAVTNQTRKSSSRRK